MLVTNHHRWRPYRVECTGSFPTSAVKRRRARLVLGWGTAREDLRVLPAFRLATFRAPRSCQSRRLAKLSSVNRCCAMCCDACELLWQRLLPTQSPGSSHRGSFRLVHAFVASQSTTHIAQCQDACDMRCIPNVHQHATRQVGHSAGVAEAYLIVDKMMPCGYRGAVGIWLRVQAGLLLR